MKSSSQAAPEPLDSHELAGHSGIVAVRPDPVRAKVEIDFDPDQLSENEVISLVDEHLQEVSSALQKSIYRLEGSACEACALKLERRVARIPGVRRATATYMGKVIVVTFDSGSTTEARLMGDLQKSGAAVSPYGKAPPSHRTFSEKLKSGELNEEISCALGLIFLIAAQLTGKFIGTGWIHHLLFIAAYGFAGQEGVRSALASLKEKVLDVDVLMVLAAIGAALIGQPFEGALLLFLFSFSNVLQRHAMERTQRAIESLLTLRPEQALVKRGGTLVRVAVEEIDVGEIVIVRPGEQIPVDGNLMEGSTHVDESSLTGESMPVAKSPGSALFAGTLNQSGGIELTVTRRSEDSAISRMVKLVAEAQAEKSNTQRFLETAEQSYAMGVILLTALVFLIPHFLMGEAAASAFYRAMTVMVVASPCALVISTPATVLSAIGGAARKGILIKGGSHLERAAKVEIVAIDKTGTLTLGKPALTEWVTPESVLPATDPLPDHVRELLAAAAALEEKSEHPLAHAIVKYAADQGLTLPPATDFQSTPGKGAEASIGGSRYLIGSERLFQESDASGITALQLASKPLQEIGRTCVWLGIRKGASVTALAVLAMADPIRPAARAMVEQLRQNGARRVIMLTGDHETVAHAIAREAGINEVRASLLPEDKLALIRELKKDGSVMMIGDGVNDAPALATSDVGMAMGAAGTNVAMETADVVLMGDRLENIPLLLSHARRARRILIQNLIFATAVILVLVCAALGFFLPLPLGVVGHEGSTVLVCLNGLRLLLVRSS